MSDKRPRSITRALIVGLLSSLLPFAVLTTSIAYLYARSTLLGEFDSVLFSKARTLSSVEQVKDNGKLDFEFAPGAMPEFERRKRPQYFVIRDAGGKVLQSSPSLRGKSLQPLESKGERPVVQDTRLPDGRHGRVVQMKFIPQADAEDVKPGEKLPTWTGGPLTIMVAVGRSSLDENLSLMLSVLAGGALVLALGTVAIVMAVVQRGLRPVKKLAQETNAIGPATLERRLDAAQAPTELLPIYTGMNNLLGRLESAFARERRFTSDVSHELKTPIAEARACLEMSLKWPDDAPLLASSCHEANDALKHMDRLVATLLAFSRAEAGSQPVPLTSVDVCAVVDHSLALVRPVQETRGVTVSRTGSEAPVLVRSNEVMLESVLANLIGNAVEYSPEKAEVRIEMKPGSGIVSVLVSNPAPDLTPEDVAAMSQPFWRKDAARTASELHSGMGLAVVSSFSRVLGIQYVVELLPENELRATLQIPSAEA